MEGETHWSLQPPQPSQEFGMSTQSISCLLQRVLHGPFRLPYLAMEDNAESHYLCSSLSQHRRAGLSDMLLRCSRALLSGCSVCLLAHFAQLLSASLMTSCRPKVIAVVKNSIVSFHSLMIFLLFNSLSYSSRLSVFCINCISRARNMVMHVYVLQADSSDTVPLLWFHFIPNAFEIIAKGVSQFFSIATVFWSHMQAWGGCFCYYTSFRITLLKQFIWFRAMAPRLLFKKNVDNGSRQ